MTTSTSTPSTPVQSTAASVPSYVLSAIRRVRSTKQRRALSGGQVGQAKVPAGVKGA